MAMCPDAAHLPGKTGMKRIEDHIPRLYSLKSLVYIATCFLAPIFVTHLINRIGWVS